MGGSHLLPPSAIDFVILKALDTSRRYCSFSHTAFDKVQQLEFFAIPSPCTGVCESGPRGFCKGCYRSREERLHWHNVDDGVKRKIIGACAMRKRRANSRKKPSGDDDTLVIQGDLGF